MMCRNYGRRINLFHNNRAEVFENGEKRLIVLELELFTMKFSGWLLVDGHVLGN